VPFFILIGYLLNPGVKKGAPDAKLHYVNGKTNAPGKKTAAMAAANDFI
jgi:hypothetical protein